MLSILIPAYNYNVTKLVGDLHTQAKSLDIDFEIIIAEDGSQTFLEENQNLQSLPNVVYIGLKENIGRAKIRNFLAKTTKYPYLLFMDCDVKVIDNQFVKKYLDILPADVVIGGYAYSQTAPEKTQILRWQYGLQREVKSANERNKMPNKSFSTFNFLIKKEIFNTVQFDESISGYGHEDTMFGWELKKKNIMVLHIDNPLLQESPDETAVFLKKTENSVQNLWLLYQKTPDKKDFSKDNHLLKTYISLKKYRLTFLISPFFGLFGKYLYKNLCSEKPRMMFFDLYKLGILNTFANSTMGNDTNTF